MKRAAVLVVSLLVVAGGASVACGTGNPAAPSMGDGGGTDGAAAAEGGSPEASPEAGGDDASDAGGTPVTVIFSYAPQWSGVKKVEVVGGFGMSTDWSKTASLVTLTESGGAFSGTAMLPPGTYLYVFRVTGDAQAPAAEVSTYPRYALDPLETAFAPCPAASPTYSKIDVNPCSQMTVTASGGPAPAAAVHVKGTVRVDGAASAGWLAVLEREEPKSHHFFVNRVTVGADGAFDLVGSAGSYRLQIQYPTLESVTDLARDPTTASPAAVRRAISAAFPLASGAVTVAIPDLAFHDYAAYAPTGNGGALPTAFTFQSGDLAKLDVYGGPGDGGVVDIGDPWFASATANDGGSVFGGDFNTAQAMQDAAAPGTRYMWGTESPAGADAGVGWTLQTLVFPITWP